MHAAPIEGFLFFAIEKLFKLEAEKDGHNFNSS